MSSESVCLTTIFVHRFISRTLHGWFREIKTCGIIWRRPQCHSNPAIWTFVSATKFVNTQIICVTLWKLFLWANSIPSNWTSCYDFFCVDLVPQHISMQHPMMPMGQMGNIILCVTSPFEFICVVVYYATQCFLKPPTFYLLEPIFSCIYII